jgi:hypothetical protein
MLRRKDFTQCILAMTKAFVGTRMLNFGKIITKKGNMIGFVV